MKASIHFNLPEEEGEFHSAFNGMKYRLALQELDFWLRNKIKYGELSEESCAIYQEIRDRLYEELDGLEL